MVMARISTATFVFVHLVSFLNAASTFLKSVDSSHSSLNSGAFFFALTQSCIQKLKLNHQQSSMYGTYYFHMCKNSYLQYSHNNTVLKYI